jgi:hypothetical protein
MRSEVKSGKQEPQFAALVSIDGGDKKHAWCLQAAGSEQRESGELEHTPERWRPGWVSCVNDSPIVPLPWRWSNRGELWCSC